MFQNSLYIGVDPTAGKKPFTYIALDEHLSITHKGSADMSETLTFIANQSNCMVAICSPYQPNQRVMEKEEIRRSVSPPLKPGRWFNYRLCEVILRKHRIKIIPTPAREQDCPRWMQKGFQLYRQLVKLGFQRYPAEALPANILKLTLTPHSRFY